MSTQASELAAAPAARAPRRRNRSTGHDPVNWWLTALLIVLALTIAIPLYFAVVTAVKTTEQLGGTGFGLPTSVRWSNFADAWRLTDFPKTALNSFKKEVSGVDQRVLDEEGPGAMSFFVEALRQGPQGVIDDYLLWARPWGFALEQIARPVHIWQGDDDLLVPLHHAEDMAVRLPNATLHRLAGVGHVSIQLHIGEIFDSLA